MAIKLECDLCGKLVTEDKTQVDGSIEEWEAHADAVRPFVGNVSTICSECFAPIETTVFAVVGALRRLHPEPELYPEPDPTRLAASTLG